MITPLLLWAAAVASGRDTSCVIRTGGPPRDTLVIGVTDSIRGARLMSAQLTRPAVRVDCLGRMRLDPASLLGDGPARYRFDSDGRLLPMEAGLPVVVFRAFPAADPRDVIDAGVDLFLTGDRGALQYAARRGNLVTVPLPWERTYLLVVRSLTTAPRLGFQRGLEDAVRVEARVATPPYWWVSDTSCGSATAGAAPPLRAAARVVYDRSDGVAQDLAERVVALRLIDPGSRRASLSAVGLAPEELSSALASGSEWAYIVPVPRSGGCPSAGDLPSWLWASRPVPLVDTRVRAVAAPGVFAEIDADGTIRIVPAPPAP